MDASILLAAWVASHALRWDHPWIMLLPDEPRGRWRLSNLADLTRQNRPIGLITWLLPPGPASAATSAVNGPPSVELTRLAEGLDAPFEVVMGAGETRFHHPLALHGSYPNASAEPRIGLPTTYCTPGLHKNGAAVAVVRGRVGFQPGFPLSSKPADLPLGETVADYRASGRQVLHFAS